MSEENAKKSLLIIKSQSGGILSVEHFLKNRDWKIKSTTNLKEALIFLVQEQPQFVMVSIDHPNPKVKKLPKVLTQAFPVCVIAFSESSSAASYSTLSASATEYILYPPVTGPAVERTVNKYYKDLQTKASLGNSSQTLEGVKSSDGVIAIRGDGPSFSQDGQSYLARFLNDDDGDFSFTQEGKSSGGHWAPLPTKAPPKKDRLTPEQVETHPQATKRESLILKGTKDALENSCKITSFQQSLPLDFPSQVACIFVDSTRFSGYLITAMAEKRVLDKAFLEKVRERLCRFLMEQGEDIGNDSSIELRIQRVPFEDWALEYAEFLRKSVHDGTEVAMAFFPRADLKTKFQESLSQEMASIKIEDLIGDVAVEFNTYVLLPRNNKYLLYTPRGGIFYNTQKERLLSQGISQLHILKADLLNVDKYRAQNFLNEKIQAFYEKEGSLPELHKEKKPA